MYSAKTIDPLIGKTRYRKNLSLLRSVRVNKNCYVQAG